MLAGPATSHLVPVARFVQKAQRCRVVLSTRVRFACPAPPDLAARSAFTTQESQIYTLGPAISFATSLGGRSHQLQTASRATVRRRHTCHQLPPAALTTCCTRWWLNDSACAISRREAPAR